MNTLDTPKTYTIEELTVDGIVFGNITRANQARQAKARKAAREAAAAANPSAAPASKKAAPKKAKGQHPAIKSVSSTDHKTVEVDGQDKPAEAPKVTRHKIHEVPGKTTPVGQPAAPAPKPTKTASNAPVTAPEATQTAKVNKGDTVLAMLSRPEGATLVQLQEATGWQAHSVRGYLAGTFKKKGHDTTNEKVDGVRVYKLAQAAPMPVAEAI